MLSYTGRCCKDLFVSELAAHGILHDWLEVVSEFPGVFDPFSLELHDNINKQLFIDQIVKVYDQSDLTGVTEVDGIGLVTLLVE